jgi:hypothetical protein
MYNLPYAYAYALSDMRRITLVLLHIVIQSPSSYKSSFSYMTSDDAETSEMLRLTIQVHMQHFGPGMTEVMHSDSLVLA